MLIYIFKSAACMATFFVFYKLLLEKENMHVFKRFYLLSALGASLLIPALVFTEYVVFEPAPYVMETQQPIFTDYDYIGVPAALKDDVLDIEPILWTVYFLGFVFFGLKFIKNLGQIIGRIRKNPKQKSASFIQVLLKENFPPHTFFKYIFLNKKKLESNEIPLEVLLHEETHAKQKHSWDVIFIELLQVIFWFNPLMYLFKKAIKLNHEFLADQAVLDKDIDETTYQNTLLSYLSPDSQNKYQSKMANAINYSSIKKRFTVMKTHTSKKAVLLRSLLLLPVLAILLFSFAETKIVQKKEAFTPDSNYTGRQLLDPDNHSQNTDLISNRSVEIAGLVLDSETYTPLEGVEIFGSNGVLLSKTDARGYFKALFNGSNEGEILFGFKAQKSNYVPIAQNEHWGNLSGQTKSTFYLGLQKEGSETPQFSELVPSGSDLNYTAVLNNFHTIKNRFEFRKKLNLAKKGNQRIVFELENKYYMASETGWIKINSMDDIISINDDKLLRASEINKRISRKQITGMTPLAENRRAPFAIYTIPVNNVVIPIGGASKAEVKEYNLLSKKYNAIPIEKRKIPLLDLKVLETVFRKMSEEQKANAQSFPECLPKNVQDGASRELMKEYNTLAKKYNTLLSESKSIRIKMKDVERLEYIYGLMSDKQKADAEPFPDFPDPPPAPKEPKAPRVKKGQKSDIPPPPPPEEMEIEEIKEVEEALEVEEIAEVEAIEEVERVGVKPPVAPMPPKSPLDHVIEMAKRDATFYYEGQKVTSDKAIQLLKDNKNLNIESTGNSSKNPKVKITKGPIYHGKASNSSKSIETGNTEINGEKVFYSKKDGVTSYFNNAGEYIDRNGKVLNKSSKNHPTFYFNERQISSDKANSLLSSNNSIQVTSKEYQNGTYAILLTDLSNYQNRNYNPNSAIDLTEMIEKEAFFFYNDKPITVEKALWLTQNNHIERVNTVASKKGKPKVYFWSKA